MKKLSGKMAPLRAQIGRVSVAIGWQAGEKAADHRLSPEPQVGNLWSNLNGMAEQAGFKPSVPLAGKCRSGPQSQNIIVTLASTRRLRRFMTAPNNRKAPIGPAISDPFTWLVAGVR